MTSNWIRIGDLAEFDLIARCAQHGEPRTEDQRICASASGFILGSDPVPLMCELGTGHAGRHVHNNGGHACWEGEAPGVVRNAVVRDFTIR
jgi:hypothetical protein